MIRSRLIVSIFCLFFIPLAAQASIALPGLKAPVKVVRDNNGIPHIYATNEHDLFFMQGRIHAEDRFFQMDVTRRSAAGTLAELFGPDVLPADVETRTIGLGRAAEDSLKAHSREMRAILQAYADGVNSYLDEVGSASQLAPEYGILQLDEVKRWEPLDSVLVGKALATITSLIVTDDIQLSAAFDAYGESLFSEVLFRSAPFDPASTVPDAETGFETSAHKPRPHKRKKLKLKASAEALKQGRAYLQRIRKMREVPGALHLDGDDMGGSNSWVVSGKHTPSRRPILANDIHLALQNPPIFHEIELSAPGFKVTGNSLAGAPCVLRGHNRDIVWGITNARLDITDIFMEEIIAKPDGTLYTYHENSDGSVSEELIKVIEEEFFFNPRVEGAELQQAPNQKVLIVARRNNGPLITPPAYDAEKGALTALSVQSVGFGPTRDPEGICALNRARNLQQFKAGLQLIDFASQNFTYADRRGNIGYFMSGELPLREDLQKVVDPQDETLEITPPFVIRDGVSGNEWIPRKKRPKNQATPFEILPFSEMPQVVNPKSGIIVNANNDQAGNTLDNDPLNDLRRDGKGLRYLNWGGRNFSLRAGRITEMINQRLTEGSGLLTFRDMKEMQADTVLNDAKALTPYILQAYDNAIAAGAVSALAPYVADPRLAEAVERLRRWDFTTPTGIAGGYDGDPAATDADASVAATIYAVWRSEIMAKSIDATLTGLGAPIDIWPRRREEVVTALKHLLETGGIGGSALDIDLLVLVSLDSALNLLASEAFDAAFNQSTDLDDYRWGKIHLVTFRHPFGGDLDVPPSSPGALTGSPIDGGFQTVDDASPSALNVRVSGSDSMRVDYGPAGRFVAWAGPFRIRAQSSLPGGNSGVWFPPSPFYQNLREPYLNNETFPLLTSPLAVKRNAFSIEHFRPGKK